MSSKEKTPTTKKSPRLSTPIKGLRYRTTKSGKKWYCRNTKLTIPDEQVFQMIKDYILNEASKPFCVSVYGATSRCTCLHYLRGDEPSLDNCTRAVKKYYETSPAERTMYVLEWKRSADGFAGAMSAVTKKACKICYLVPSVPDENDKESKLAFAKKKHYVCCHGACRLLCIGKNQYGRMMASLGD